MSETGDHGPYVETRDLVVGRRYHVGEVVHWCGTCSGFRTPQEAVAVFLGWYEGDRQASYQEAEAAYNGPLNRIIAKWKTPEVTIEASLFKFYACEIKKK